MQHAMPQRLQMVAHRKRRSMDATEITVSSVVRENTARERQHTVVEIEEYNAAVQENIAREVPANTMAEIEEYNAAVQENTAREVPANAMAEMRRVNRAACLQTAFFRHSFPTCSSL